MKKFYSFFFALLVYRMCFAEVAPMVVQGRSWEYEEETVEYYKPHLKKFTVKIEGETTIDGQQYAVLNAYYDDQTTPDQGIPYGYLRETHDGKIYARINMEYDYLDELKYSVDGMEFLYDGSEFLLADYNDFFASQTYGYLLNPEEALDIYDYVNAVNTLKVWQLVIQYGQAPGKELRLVEKVGYVWPDQPCNIFSPVYVRPTGADHEGWLYLQCVKDADGSIIYEVDNKYSSQITVTADEASDDVYYDLFGRKCDTSSQASGIYIRKHGTHSSKMLIK